MTSAMKIASAPISWGICDAPDYGYQYPYEEVLREMQEIGIVASELGSRGFLPDDPQEAGDALRSHGLEPVGLYLDQVFHTESDAWRDELREKIAYVKDSGASTIVLAALPAYQTYAPHDGLSEQEWRRLLANLDEATDIAAEAGVELAIHPHLGTLVLTPDEIERVLTGSKIKFCLDTGHGIAGGNDVVDLVRKVGDRLVMVHLKDARNELFDRLNRGEIEFFDAVAEGIFCSLGDGDLPIDALFDALRDIDYAGWLVLEQDARFLERPAVSPKDDIARSLAVVKAQLAA